MKLSISTFKRSQTYFQSTCNHLWRGFNTVGNEEKIQIPKRIHRSSTDILRALETTVSRDPTAPHYKYHDDPYLIPMSNVGKRTFAMAQEAGRKAAHWVRKENAELFNHLEAEPVIEAFLPKLVYTEDSKVSEDDLIKIIGNGQVQDAQIVYKLLKNQGTEISADTQQALLELVCYYNCTDGIPEEFIEERWFKQSSNLKERQRKTWKDSSFAEELFQTISNPSAETYCTIIQGMNKYFQVDRAYKLFEEAQNKGFVLTTDTYNSVIRVANFLKESFDMRWTFVINMLADMNNAGVKPNLGTLNSVMHVLSTMGTSKTIKDYALNVLSEFKSLGIEPSLGTWYYVLVTFCKERGAVSTILHDIMNHLENKELQIRDLNDTNFFVTAMDICRNHLNDAELAKRVDKLLHIGLNYDLIGDSYKESIYYRHYFILMATNTPLEEFMSNIYDVLVPNIYVPEPGVMSEILNQIELNAAVEYIPQIWTDMTTFDHTDREPLVNSVLNIMTEDVSHKKDLTESFAKIAWDIYFKVENQNANKISKISLTGDLLGKVMLLLLRNDDFEKACKIMDKLNRGHQSVAGVPKIEVLESFIDHCIERKLPTRAIICLEYCADSGFPECGVLAAKLNEKLTLDQDHLNRLSRIVGDIKLSGRVTEEEL